MEEIDKVAFIETKGGQVLTSRSKGKTKYYIPGGKRELGETDEQTLIREIKEELNVTIQPATIEYVGTFKAQADGRDEGVIVKMTCYKAKYDGTAEASSEIDELRWLTYEDIDLVAPVDKRIFKYLREKGEL